MTSRNLFKISLVALAAGLFLPASVSAWNLQGSCTGSPLTAQVGGVVNWTATQTSTLQPGQGHYEWVWSGTDGLSGTTQSIQKTYTAAGVKNATVLIKLVLTSGKIESITRTCSITVTPPPPPATLMVIKRVVNDNGGTKTPADFTIRVKSGAIDVAGSPAPGSSVGITYTLAPGTYTVSENTPPVGYTQTGISGACASNGAITLASGDSKTCTITNDDTPPPQLVGSCAVTPGTGAVGSSFTWSASASGGTGTFAYTWTGSDGLSGNTPTVSKSYGTVGTKNGTIIITSGSQSVLSSCSVTVTAISPATLKVIKQVTNNNGGTKTPADFSIHVKSGTTHVSGSPAAGSSSGTTYTLPAGTYTVSEGAVSGYTQTGISGDCVANGSVTLASGDSKTCTVVNDDNPPGAFDGVCAVTPSTGGVGSSFAWSASATGGTGSYTFSWSGTEGLSGTSASVNKSYASGGTKTGSVVITSGSQSVTKDCSVVVTVTETAFDGVCSVSPSSAFIGDAITWNASATGGTGTYTYSWSGDGNLSGTAANVSNTYSSAGTKLGTVEMTSGTNTTTKTCSVSITPRTTSCQSGCGGGYDQPNVVLFKKAASSPLASASIYLSQTPYVSTSSAIYLSQIPYTGVVADNAKAVVYIVILLALSGFITYFIFRKRNDDRRLFRDNIHLTNITSAPRAAKRSDSSSEGGVSESEFIAWLVSDDSQRVFDYLRSLKHQDKDISKFVTDIASELDLVYRNRIDKNIAPPPERIVKIVEHWNNKKLEDVISILVGSVDESYHSNYTPITLAMAKIMKMKP